MLEKNRYKYTIAIQIYNSQGIILTNKDYETTVLDKKVRYGNKVETCLIWHLAL